MSYIYAHTDIFDKGCDIRVDLATESIEVRTWQGLSTGSKAATSITRYIFEEGFTLSRRALPFIISNY